MGFDSKSVSHLQPPCWGFSFALGCGIFPKSHFRATHLLLQSLLSQWGFSALGGRDKKTFLSDQCKEIEENNRMGKTRDLFKKIRDTKRTFHAKMGTIKDTNGMDLTEAEYIKKR